MLSRRGRGAGDMPLLVMLRPQILAISGRFTSFEPGPHLPCSDDNLHLPALLE